MARLNLNRQSSASSLYRGRSTIEPSPSLAIDEASDKENDSRHVPALKAAARSRVSAMNPPASRSVLRDAHDNKRRRLTEDDRDVRSTSVASACPVQTLNTQFGQQETREESNKYYDPNQNAEYRQGLRVAIRKNHQRLNDSRGDLLRGDNGQLISSLKREDRLMDEVRQTSDAVLDARFIVGVAELSSKKLSDEARGKNSRGLDVEDFISKCISFMRSDNGAHRTERSANTSRRRAETQPSAGETYDEDDGDMLDWDVLGEHAAFPSNRRPPVPSFLLGVLSLEKKVRNTQASARQRRDPISALKRPEELQAADLERNDKDNLASICSGIRDRLNIASATFVENINTADQDAMSDAEKAALFRDNHLSNNWEISLFEFAINPNSFAQSVENLFYISFLIKDGLLELNTDGDGLPTIRGLDEGEKSARQARRSTERHQAIFSLDYDSWQKLIKAFKITSSMIPDRQEAGTQLGAGGWYT